MANPLYNWILIDVVLLILGATTSIVSMANPLYNWILIDVVLLILGATTSIVSMAELQYGTSTMYEILQSCLPLIEVVLIIGIESVYRWGPPRRSARPWEVLDEERNLQNSQHRAHRKENRQIRNPGNEQLSVPNSKYGATTSLPVSDERSKLKNGTNNPATHHRRSAAKATAYVPKLFTKYGMTEAV